MLKTLRINFLIVNLNNTDSAKIVLAVSLQLPGSWKHALKHENLKALVILYFHLQQKLPYLLGYHAGKYLMIGYHKSIRIDQREKTDVGSGIIWIPGGVTFLFRKLAKPGTNFHAVELESSA